ncbi:MAG TPA: alpha-L-arabinofuranosidase C-terminal domain-containing protein [Balneolaceae bacterium]|nr:alpha-L-arabinofuranosidase C-terminal domain-containing protein [Balneolaceae bacterium]
MKKILFLSVVLLFSSFSRLAAQDKIVVEADQPQNKISKYIYGQFSEHLGKGIYGGLWVGEDSDIPNTDGFRNDVVNALKELNIPDIRWPGGCFADEYHWRDGIGPRDQRPVRINTHWGGVLEHNQVGTHEFMELTDMLGTDRYISANVGSGTVEEMANWIEYMTYGGNSTLANLRRKNGRDKPWKVKFLGIGNESWGCGGNMPADYYADLYRRYATFAKDFSGNHLFKIASGFSNDHYDWTETLVKKAGYMMNAISLHYYTLATGNWQHKGPSKDFGENMYFHGLKQGLRIKKLIEGHETRMDKYDPQKRIALAVDEWGIWTDPLPGSHPGFLRQQNSLRDALIASTTLDIFNHHSDRVRMANIAQTVNVLQAMVMTDGKKMFKTPTYWVFDFYKVHHDAQLLPTYLNADKYTYKDESIPGLSSTASKDSTGAIHLTVTNLHASESRTVTVDIRGMNVKGVSNARILTADAVDAINTFDDPDNVSPKDYSNYNLHDSQLTLRLPSKSVIVLKIR